MQMCAVDKDGKEVIKGGHIACQAYIAGIIDYHNLMRSLGTAPTVDFCVPDNIDLNVLQQQTHSYIFKNRYQHGQFTAVPGVVLGMFSHYPCKRR